MNINILNDDIVKVIDYMPDLVNKTYVYVLYISDNYEINTQFQEMLRRYISFNILKTYYNKPTCYYISYDNIIELSKLSKLDIFFYKIIASMLNIDYIKIKKEEKYVFYYTPIKKLDEHKSYMIDMLFSLLYKYITIDIYCELIQSYGKCIILSEDIIKQIINIILGTELSTSILSTSILSNFIQKLNDTGMTVSTDQHKNKYLKYKKKYIELKLKK